MNRVLVIGCPGSGKSVLCRRLAEATGLPLIHLDAYYHDETRWSESESLKQYEWRKLVESLVQGQQWIIDGNYKGTFDIRVPAADTIIVLDYPRWLTLIRLFKRRIEFHKRLRPDMPATWREKIDWDFFQFVWNYRRRERDKVLSLLEQHALGKTIVIATSPREAEQWLATIRI